VWLPSLRAYHSSSPTTPGRERLRPGSLYTPSDLPVDQPFLLHFWITDDTCSTFAASCLYADKNPVDNAIDVWLQKPSCR